MSGETVIVVEDDEDIQLTVRLALELSGFHVIAVTSGEDALALLESETAHVVLLDLTLPGMGGWETLERLREDARLGGLPVIVVSGHTGDDVTRRAAGLGASQLTKPFDIRDLNRSVLDALEAAKNPQP